jgi:hypothetical protein
MDNNNFRLKKLNHWKKILIPTINKSSFYSDENVLFNRNVENSNPITSFHEIWFSENIEYNIDDEDDYWLNKYNEGQIKLSSNSFENAIIQLEKVYSQEIIRLKEVREKLKIYKRRSTNRRSKEEIAEHTAFKSLLKYFELNNTVANVVFSYWSEKRLRMGNLLIRKLQMYISIQQLATPYQDKDPNKVFRPRTFAKRAATRFFKKRRASMQFKTSEIRMLMSNYQCLMNNLVYREKLKRKLSMIEINILGVLVKLSTYVTYTERENIKYNKNEATIRLGFKMILKSTLVENDKQVNTKRKLKNFETVDPDFISTCLDYA